MNRSGLEIGQASDPGLRRESNEDALGYRVPDSPSERGALFVVCDGIGSLKGGRRASSIAVATFLESYYSGNAASVPELLRRAAGDANRAVRSSAPAGDRHQRMGTTLVAAALIGQDSWVLNIGDSRAYLSQAGAMRQISIDHTPATRHDARDRRIDRAVGTDELVSPDVFGPLLVLPGGRLLLCSDGLTSVLDDRAIARTLEQSTPAEAARQLVESAKTAGAPDNVSVIVVEYPGQSAVRVRGIPLAEGMGICPGRADQFALDGAYCRILSSGYNHFWRLEYDSRSNNVDTLGLDRARDRTGHWLETGSVESGRT